MKNKFLTDTLTFASVLVALFVFFKISIAGELKTDTKLTYYFDYIGANTDNSINDSSIVENKDSIVNDLKSIPGVDQVKIDLETEQINIFCNKSEASDIVDKVQPALNKYGISFDDEVDIDSIIADSDQ